MAQGEIVKGPNGDEVVLADVGQEVVFENDHLRVWEIILEPGQQQDWHRHDHPYLVIALEPGDNRIDPISGGDPRLVHEPAGGVVFREPGEVHKLTNRGTTRYRSRLIELREAERNGRGEDHG
jgi:quercetin dioxygenase-like cupin family protein